MDDLVALPLHLLVASQSPHHFRSSIMTALRASQSACSFPFTPVCAGQYIHMRQQGLCLPRVQRALKTGTGPRRREQTNHQDLHNHRLRMQDGGDAHLHL